MKRGPIAAVAALGLGWAIGLFIVAAIYLIYGLLRLLHWIFP